MAGVAGWLYPAAGIIGKQCSSSWPCSLDHAWKLTSKTKNEVILSLVPDEQGPTAYALDSEPTLGVSASRLCTSPVACRNGGLKGACPRLPALQALDSAEFHADGRPKEHQGTSEPSGARFS